MKKLLPFFKKNLYPIFLIFISLIVCFLNYKPATWLSGWDTLHPEFNFPLNFKRLFFGVWREDQGLGAIAGHSHMADLPRVIILWLFSFIFPLSFLRYFYIFLCLIFGPLGVFYFINHILKESKAAFLGALFYLFNLGTLQHFYVPFEMFTVQYAGLGWLFLWATKIFESPKKKDLLLFALISFLTSPQAYASTLFYVYVLCLGIYILFLSLPSIFKKDFSILKKLFLILLIIFLTNSFWILPNLYFLKTNAKNIPLAKINLLFSEEAFLKNQKYGTIQDTAVLKNFLFSWLKIKDGQFVYLFDTWREYFVKYSFVVVFGYLVFLFIVFGLYLGFVKKQKFLLSLLPVFFVSFFFLIGMNWPFTFIYSFFQTKVPLFGEALRMPFTKFSLILMFVYSVYFAKANGWLLKRFIKKEFFLVLFWLVLFGIYCFPYFKGELISPQMRVRIPQDYFEVFEWFNKQKNFGRIANFPSPVYSGWEYYNWGFQGAGFFWFGEKMPLLTRDFDRWNSKNENYYHKISYALYSKNLALFEKILEKYQISWLLVDGNVVSYTSPKSLYLEELEELISGSSKIFLAAQFGKIKIYQVDLESKPKNFVFLAQNLPQIEPDYKWNNFDKGYEEYGDYLTETQNLKLKTQNQDLNLKNEEGEIIYYPFRSLFTGRRQEELEFGIEEKEDYFVFKAKIPKDLVGKKLVLPEIEEEEITEIDKDDLSQRKTFLPKVYLDGELIPVATNSSEVKLSYIKEGNFEIWVPKIRGLMSYDSKEDKEFLKKEAQSCDAFNKGGYKLEKLKENEKEFLRFEAEDQASCLDIWLPNLENRIGYLVSLQARFQQGKSLLFWLENLQSRKADIETYLPKRQKFEKYYFIQSPMAKDGLGYSLHFNNISIGRVRSVNDLARVTVNPIPYKFLTGIKIINGQQSVASYHSSDIKVSHSNEGFYKIEITNTQYLTPNTYLVLSQSFSKDWLAFQFKIENLKLKINFFPHVLVNNWENGWQIGNHPLATSRQSPITIYLFFWPQLLEYLGFGLLLVCFLVISRYGSEALQYPHQKS